MKTSDFKDGDRVYHTRIKRYGTVQRDLANNRNRFVGIKWDEPTPADLYAPDGGYTPDNLERR